MHLGSNKSAFRSCARFLQLLASDVAQAFRAGALEMDVNDCGTTSIVLEDRAEDSRIFCGVYLFELIAGEVRARSVYLPARNWSQSSSLASEAGAAVIQPCCNDDARMS